MDFWELVKPVWEMIDFYQTSERFLETFEAAPLASRTLYAAHWCVSEVCNGGVQQFFWNSTGMLTPEAIVAFRELGMPATADLIEDVAGELGDPFPRDRGIRQARLEGISENQLDAITDKFLELIESENGGFNHSANAYADRMTKKGSTD